MSGAESAPVAAALLARFGSLRGVLNAPPRQVRRVVKDDGRVAAHLAAIHDAVQWVLRSELEDRPIIDSGRALTDYLRFVQGFDQVEVIRVLYLDSGKHLLKEEIAARGTIDEAPIYVREIVRQALDLGAAGLVLVHNHPSGNVTPSQDDIALTRRLVEGARTMGLIVYDHMIVSAGHYFSLRAEGLL